MSSPAEKARELLIAKGIDPDACLPNNDVDPYELVARDWPLSVEDIRKVLSDHIMSGRPTPQPVVFCEFCKLGLPSVRIQERHCQLTAQWRYLHDFCSRGVPR